MKTIKKYFVNMYYTYINPMHDSDCATNNEPAYPDGDCNCRLQST